MPIYTVQGVPGIGQTYTASPKNILQNLQGAEYLEGGRVIDGAAAGDWSNPAASYVLTSGLLLGKITASGKYAPSILGVTQAAITNASTSLTVTPAQATEIARRIGSSGAGTIAIVGPPTAAGTVASETLTFSAINTTTGVITITHPAAAYAAGSIIVPQDGSQSPLVVLDALYGLWIADSFLNRQDTPAPRLLVAGHLISSKIPAFLDADASVQTYLKSQLNSSGRHFLFDTDY